MGKTGEKRLQACSGGGSPSQDWLYAAYTRRCHSALPASGNRNGSSLNNHGSNGNYWSATLNSGNANNAYNLNFNSGNHNPNNNNNRYNGHTVRPVAAPAFPWDTGNTGRARPCRAGLAEMWKSPSQRSARVRKAAACSPYRRLYNQVLPLSFFGNL